MSRNRQNTFTIMSILLFSTALCFGSSRPPRADEQPNAVAPLPPLPDSRQLAWHGDDLTVFVHFGMNTYTGRSVGTGSENPDLFNPTRLDCEQWAREAKMAGFKAMILTAKHHDGFCLWPTQTTRHSVASSAWRDGKGDVVRELSDACRKYGLKFGVYCSPWDISMNQSYTPEEYSKLYIQQLRELLTNYGPVYEMWFDGNNASVPNWDEVIQLVRKLQPGAIIKEGPRVRPVSSDARWVGNERAICKLANWNVYPEPGSDLDEKKIWFPVEPDTPMIGNWFWADTLPLDLPTLLNYYYTSVGRGEVLLLNIAPDRSGIWEPNTVKRLHEFAAAVRAIYNPDYARAPETTASASDVRHGKGFGPENVLDGDPSTFWATDDGVTTAQLTVDLGTPKEFNVIRLEEPIRLGQRVARYRLDVWDEQTGTWKVVNDQGYTIGRRKLDRIPEQHSSKVRLTILESRACPLISSVGVHIDETSPAAHFDPAFANADKIDKTNKRKPKQKPRP